MGSGELVDASGVVIGGQSSGIQDCSAGMAVSAAKETVLTHFPSLWPAVEVGLATCSTLLLSDNANPAALIYVGPASAGKTTVVMMFDGTTYNGESLCYRSDKFTPASFVTQSANATKEQLADVDLLPRIRHKVLLTPELSTIFRGKQDELAERFSTITRVLDGQGLMTDSGTHGRRGYEGDYLFSWLGATTPFEPKVWEVMAQLGSRMFFFVLDDVASPSIKQLIECNCSLGSYSQGLAQCQTVVREVLSSVFRKYGGVRQVQWDAGMNPGTVMKSVACCATLLALMRTPWCKEGKPEPESPYRANAVLYNLARGHALVWGRTYLTDDDVPLLFQVTLSSILQHRRLLFLALVGHPGGELTVAQVQSVLGVKSLETARSAMMEMDWLGIAQLYEPGKGKPTILTLHPNWAWCAGKDFKTFLSAHT